MYVPLFVSKISNIILLLFLIQVKTDNYHGNCFSFDYLCLKYSLHILTKHILHGISREWNFVLSSHENGPWAINKIVI